MPTKITNVSAEIDGQDTPMSLGWNRFFENRTIFHPGFVWLTDMSRFFLLVVVSFLAAPSLSLWSGSLGVKTANLNVFFEVSLFRQNKMVESQIQSVEGSDQWSQCQWKDYIPLIPSMPDCVFNTRLILWIKIHHKL